MTKLLAFYLPQYHTFPENDKWWGEGFTEWTNVKKAKKLYKKHNQPRVPLNQHYYHLLNKKDIAHQMELAKKYNVYGFCYYHYWFDGKLLMEKPLEIIREMDEKVPYCMCWANEPWTRAWDGGSKEVLIDQKYGGEKEWEEHFQYLLKFFKDKYYIQIDGKPVLLIYRTNNIPNCNEMISYWKKKAQEVGFNGLYIVEERNSFQKEIYSKYSDAILDFEPQYTMRHRRTYFHKGYDKIRRGLFNLITHSKITLYDYDVLWRISLRRKYKKQSYQQFLGAFVDWDNTARRGKTCTLVTGSTPEKFEKYLKMQKRKAEEIESEFVFVNAWNEWAEGTYLEPDEKNKYAYLEAVRNVFGSNKE